MPKLGKESIYSFSRTENFGLPYSAFISPDRADDLQDLRDRVESLELENANLRDRLQVTRTWMEFIQNSLILA